ncbi:MAG: V-type ATP synthase subunit F [Eubacteriales bacterium]
MYKIGIIGERESVLGFMALGFSVHEAENAQRAGELLHSMAKSGEYAVIFIMENYAAELEDEIAHYKTAPLPAITVIPGSRGSTGYGIEGMRSAVERAVGADIIFRDGN